MATVEGDMAQSARTGLLGRYRYSDDAFVRTIEEVVSSHLADPDFGTYQAASVAGISRMHLNRKLRALTGQSTREFIRTIRLQHSSTLLRQKSYRVSDVARQVGFRSLSHFAKVFRKQFGVTPSKYQRCGSSDIS
jgi:AraC-like DNA-binding protein